MKLTTEKLRAEMIEKIAVASGLRARDGRNEVAEAIYAEVVEPLLAANREAQPVGKAEITKIAAELVRGDYLSKLWTEAEKSRHVDTHRLQNLLDELHDVMKVKAIAITQLLTAPPAPAVPDELLDAMEEVIRISDRDHEAWDKAKAAITACRAAMLAQPVSQGYKLNSPEIPDGWKLVPIDATRAMIDAAQRVEEDGYDAMHKAMLAAAPEGGNG